MQKEASLTSSFLPHDALQTLLDTLQAAGFHCIGPQVRDGAVMYEPLERVEQLPWGIQDEQAPGHYRLKESGVRQAFGVVNGPQGIKPQLFQPREVLWKVTRDETGKLTFNSNKAEAPNQALLGVRPCDLVAMSIQDKVFTRTQFEDPAYRARREKLFIIAANCTSSSANCFCVSAGGSPEAKAYYDLAMTELDNGFVVKAGSEQGQAILEQLNLQSAEESACQDAQARIADAAAMQKKTLPGTNLRDALFANLDHPRWDEVAERCLSCTNCTQVCPTCFCHNEGEQPSLDGQTSEHFREWDSCFTAGHSYMHGQVIHDDTRKRYRQWLVHKLGSWHDQFGTSGCVGCGRCVSWCPVGIDITEEATAICGPQLPEAGDR